MKEKTRKRIENGLLVACGVSFVASLAYVAGKQKGFNIGAERGAKLGFDTGAEFMHYAHLEAYSKNGNFTKEHLNKFCNDMGWGGERYKRFKQRDPGFWKVRK